MGVKVKNIKIVNSFKYAIEGIKSSLKTERNLKIHFVFMILVIICGVIFKISLLEWLICISLFALVISAELFNTAIEITVDLAMPKINPKAKLAKDISAGAVLVTAFLSAMIGLIIFIPKLIALIK